MDERATFRDKFDEFVRSRGYTSLQSISNEQTRSKLMTRFYLEEVVRKLEPDLIPDDPEEIEEGIIDGTGDGGVDFISRQGAKVLIVQAKYHARKREAEPKEFSNFREVLNRLHRPQREKLNDRLLEMLSDIDWEGDAFELHFITLGKTNETMRNEEIRGISAIPGLVDLQERCDLTLFDEVGLNTRIRDAISAGDTLRRPITLRLPDGWIRFDGADRSAYLGWISGAELSALYNRVDARNRLFSANIRHYVGSTKTNAGIETSAIKEPENFFFFNNGVSAIANGIVENEKEGTLECTRFSVVNGAQTVRSLVQVARNGKAINQLNQVRVLLRLTDTKKATNQETEFLDKLTRFNNTQNEIKLSDFRSNDKVQAQLRDFFSRLPFRGARSNGVVYKPKRNSERLTGKHVIGMETFARSVFSFQFGPDDVYGGTKYLFDPEKDGGYRRVFGADGPDAEMAQSEFLRLAGIWFLCFSAKEALIRIKTEHKNQMDEKLAIERKWMVFYALGETFRLQYKRRGVDLAEDLRRLAKPDWLDLSGPTKDRIEKYTRIACQALIDAYGDAAKADGFVPRNWFRKDESLHAIGHACERLIGMSSVFGKELPLLTQAGS
jgi:hypothetical protein